MNVMVLFCGLGWVLSMTVPCVGALTPMTLNASPSGSLSLAIRDVAAIVAAKFCAMVGPTSFAATGTLLAVEGLNMTSTQKFVP